MNLKDIFGRIQAEPGTEAKGPTLDTYFEKTPQLCEALPDRLRGVIDLAQLAQIEIEAKKRKPYAPASRVVEAIWRHAVHESRVAIEGYDEEMVQVDERTGALRIQIARNPSGMYATDIKWVARSPVGGAGPALTLGVVGRFTAPLEGGKKLPPRLTAALMLAADVAAEQTNGGWDMTATRQSGYEGIFAKSHYQPNSASSSLRFAWPLPAGFSLPFYVAFSSRWTAKLRSMGKREQEPWDASPEQLDEMARCFLFLVVYLWNESNDLSTAVRTPNWTTLASLVVSLSLRGAAPWRMWALQRAGLLAAPEYGLPASSANAWLEALLPATGEAHRKVLTEGLLAERRKRLEAAKEQDERVLTDIDDAFHDHAWMSQVEGRVFLLGRSELEPQHAEALPAPEPGAGKEGSVADFKKLLNGCGISSPMSLRATQVLSEVSNAPILGRLIVAVRSSRNWPHARLLDALWAQVTIGEPTLRELVRLEDRRLDFGTMRAQYQTIEWVVQENESPVPKYVACSPEGFETDILFAGRDVRIDQSKTPLIREMYRFIWDASVDLGMAKDPSSPFSEWSPLFMVITKYTPYRLPWPLARWPRFRIEEQMRECWSAALSFLNKEDVRDLNASEKLDALAFWFFHVNARLVAAGNVSDFDRLDFNTNSGIWIDRVQRDYHDPRVHIDEFLRWYTRAVLLAAPESGLSDEAAAWIVGAFKTLRIPALVDPINLQEFRRKRLQDADVPNPEDILLAIDADAKASKHPWAELIPEGG